MRDKDMMIRYASSSHNLNAQVKKPFNAYTGLILSSKVNSNNLKTVRQH